MGRRDPFLLLPAEEIELGMQGQLTDLQVLKFDLGGPSASLKGS
jgi:hypothetical protein